MAVGIEGLPFQILVSVIVVGLTAPVVLSGLSAYEVQEVSARAAAAVEAVVRLAQRFYLSGGGAQDVRVDLEGGLTARVEHVAIGDRPGGAWAASARIQVSGQSEFVLVAAPPVPMAGPDGPLFLGPGRHWVHVSYDGQGPVRMAAVG